MSAAKTVLTVAATVVLLPLAMRARESGSARASLLPNMSVSKEDPQATAEDVRAYLEGMRGANALQQIARNGLPALSIIDDDILLLSAADVLAVLKEAGFEGPVVRLREPGRQADGHDCAASVAKPVQVPALFGAIEHALGLRA